MLLAEAAREREQAAREALDLLEEARAEVDALRRRRDSILAELGGLSGVIQALAVPEPVAAWVPPRNPPPPPTED